MSSYDELVERLIVERFAGEDEVRSDPAAEETEVDLLFSELLDALANLFVEEGPSARPLRLVV